MSATFGRSASEKSMIHNNERGGDQGPTGMHPSGIDRFPGSGSKQYNSSSSGGNIQHSISNELISIPQSTIENFGISNPYYHSNNQNGQMPAIIGPPGYQGPP